jgi:hypothetical protein
MVRQVVAMQAACDMIQPSLSTGKAELFLRVYGY